jgi:predicted ATPase/DNA-binding SARP family transcriptional activator
MTAVALSREAGESKRRQRDSEAAVDFRILGPFEVDGVSGPLAIRGNKRRGLLALFVCNAGNVLSRDRIIEDLWDDDAPGADHTIQTYISQLRKLLGDDVHIETVGRGYRFDAPRNSLDLARFSDLARAADNESAIERRRDLLREALACWRGAPLEEFAGALWADTMAQRLEQRRLEILELRIDLDLALGRARELIGELEDLVRAYPLAEPLWAQRMIALYRCGRQADALRAYGDLRSRLTAELGIEPSQSLANLERRILDQDPGLLSPAEPTAAEVVNRPSASSELPAGTVTFLLTDIVSSSEMWELHPNEMATAVREHESIIESIVAAQSGHLLKHRGEGDSTLSAFDRAVEALEAAVEIQQRFAHERDRLALPLVLRVALHTGEVEQRDRDYFGRTLNRAARLRSLAVDNEILCSRVTAELVVDSLPPSVALVELGSHRLRGMRRNEVVFRVGTVDDIDAESMSAAAGGEERALGDVDFMPSRLGASVAGGTSLVGREQESTLLADAWHRARDGERQIVFISGEPGIGKTRLAAEVAMLARGDGATVLYGRSDEGLGVPFQPFVEALRSYVEACSDDELRQSLGRFPGELVRLLPDLADRAIELSTPLRSDPATEQYRLFDAVSSWLRSMSRRKPVVLVLDDLQYATDPTLLLLRHAASSDQPGRIFVVATYRESAIGHADGLIRLLADLRRTSVPSCVQHLEIRGLDEEGIATFVSIASRRDLDEAARQFAHELHAHTGGNPFFVKEILQSLVETGEIGTDVQRLGEMNLQDMKLPAAAREVVLRRVARLSEHSQRALTVGAVMGSEFDVTILEATMGTNGEAILDALEEASAARLIEECALERFSFSHMLVRAALYEGLTESRQVRLHRRVGEAIERVHSQAIGSHLSELAYHYAKAAPNKAVGYAIAAADAALESLAFGDAANVCERALDALERARGSEMAVAVADECDLLLRLGRAEFRAGHARARDTLLRSFELARELRDPRRMADAVLAANRGFFARMGGTDRALVRAIEQAIESQPPGHTAVLAELLAALASELEWADDGDRRFALSDRALAIARDVGDLHALAQVLSLRALTIAAPDTLAERRANCDELLTVADEVGDPALNFQAAWSRSSTSVELGDCGAVDETVVLASSLADELRRPTFRWQASFMRAAHAILRGELEEAEQLALETLALGQDADQSVEAFLFYNEQMLEIRRWQDRLPEMIDPLREFAGNAASDFGFALTRYIYDAGDTEYAAACYETIFTEFRIPPRRDLLAATTVCNLAYLAARLGDLRRAGTLYEAIRPYASAFASTTVAKPVGEHFLGLLAAAQNDVEGAEAHFSLALEAHERAGAPLLAAETCLEWARVLDAATQTPRREALLDIARATATTTQAAFIERRCGEITAVARDS